MPNVPEHLVDRNLKHGFWKAQSSYSGCDIIPVLFGKDPDSDLSRLYVVGDIQTLTYSIHRDKGAVRTLGRTKPKGFTRGGRTVAGTMIFSVFDRRALWEISKSKLSGLRPGSPGKKESNERPRRVAIADSLPGFDIILYFTNEYGVESTLVLYNIQVIDEGQSHSVQDMYIENTMSYIAQDIDLLEPKEKVSVRLPSSGTFIARKRDELVRAAGPDGLAFDYSYLAVGR